MRLIKVLALILFFGKSVIAQYYSTGEDPAAIRWKEITTSNFQLIFPAEYEQKAIKLAYIMEKVYAYGYRTLGHPPKKISIILHTHTVTSNGLVAWSPKRIEFYTTPNQKIYAQDWLEQLAIHEFRHVVQMDKIQSELPAIIRILFGEQAAATVVGAYLPFWFIEGDAVMTETALSRAGRGRLPSFLMETKAQVVEKGIFSYDKASLGSYKDYISNRYKFGYWFAGAIRERYGAEIWPDVLDELAGKPLSVNPVNRILKQKTGSGKEELYKRIFQEYADEWKQEIAVLKISKYRIVSPQCNSYTNYKYITALSDSSFIALRESREDIDRIVLVTSGKENFIITPGWILEESLSVTGNLIIWAEQRPDTRWEHASRAVIVIYDMITRTKKEFRYENTLLSPVIAPDKRSFVAVETDFLNNYQLGVFDVQTGEKISGFAVPDNPYFLTPAWNPSARLVYFVALSSAGKYLGSLDLQTGQVSMLTQPDYHDIRNPEFSHGNLYYTSARTGIDNIFCLNLSSGKTTQITSVPFGADYPSIAENKLFFSNYSSDGYRVAVQNLQDDPGIPLDEIKSATYKLADSLANQEDTVFNFSTSVYPDYPVKPYRKLAHLFNFHSWAPLYINVNDYEVQPGVSLLSQNKLGTANTILGYAYDPAENTGKYKIEFEYSGFFPVFKTELSYGKRKSLYYRIINNGNDTISQEYSWKELVWNLNMRLPFSFSRGKYSQFFQPEVEYNYEKVMMDASVPDELHKGYYHSLGYRLFFQNMLRKAELDILPNWGQALDLYYRHSPGGGTQINDLKAAENWLYFPGLDKNHGIRIYNGYQVKGTDVIYAFSDVVRFPRGFERIRNNKLYTFGVDYMMPLCYPDLSLGRFFFLKRLRTSLFYDFSNYESILYSKSGTKMGTITGNLNAWGAELVADGHFLRIVAPVSAGLRGVYRPDYKDFRFEFLLSVNFGLL
jgi:hypothetical protein